ncbi:MAG TPA: L-threonylcarbamoyladenylate synthase [Methylophilus sp.]|nr:L-threonylcarbamoyladenylate synthase [Methylophilus sp.]HQQ33767.1 L-threonylcarbamoyladenylate synthase [Methylophilus sp.]
MIVDLPTAISKLKAGEVVAIPTETVYGLAADASNDNALEQIYAIKQRPANNPLIVHIADISHINDWAAEFTPLAERLAQAFWPGPLTLVLPAKAHVSSLLRANQPTVALRVPDHPLTLQLLKQSGLALAAPSANKFTQLSPTTAAHVQAGLGDALPVLDGGPCQIGIESTIVAVQGNDWQMLRPGMISAATIEAAAGKPAVSFSQPIKAPGQHALHYSPRTKMQLVPSRKELIALANDSTAALLIGEGVLPNCKSFQLNKHAPNVAQHLYSTLHQMDALGKQLLLVETPPDAPEWAAILDRMTRAAS